MSSRDSVGIKLATLSSSAGSFTRLFDRHSGEVSRPQKVALRKISKNDRHQCLAPQRRTKGFSSRVMQWVCSLRDSLQGLDELTLPIRPTNRLPTSPLGAGHKATGRLHCYICNFSRVAHATLQCKSRMALFLAPLRDSLSIATGSPSRNPFLLWKEAPFCGKRPAAAPDQGARPLTAAK